MSLLTHKSYYNILSLVTRLTQGSLNTRGPNKFNGLVRSPLGVAVDTEKKEMEKNHSSYLLRSLLHARTQACHVPRSVLISQRIFLPSTWTCFFHSFETHV
jgi:hypothetical protein